MLKIWGPQVVKGPSWGQKEIDPQENLLTNMAKLNHVVALLFLFKFWTP